MQFKLPQFPGRSSEDHSQQKHASLDDILPTKDQRSDLIHHVASCTEHMRTALKSTFEQDGSHSTTTEQTQSDLSWMPAMGLSSTKMKTMKTAALAHINQWREKLLHRLAESMDVDKDILRSLEQRVAQQDTEADNQSTKLPFPRVPLPSRLASFDEKHRALVLGAVLFMVLSLEHYSSFSRTLMHYLSINFQLPYQILAEQETTTAATLLEAASKAGSIDAEDARQKQADDGAFGRKWKVGLSAVAGAAVSGITGGLAAPLILGLGATIMGGIGLGGVATLLGATIINPVTIGALFGALGGRMTGRAMEAYSKEVEDFKFLPVKDIKPQSAQSARDQQVPTPEHKLRVAIGISGWVTKESDVSLPWRIFSDHSVESFALRYEQAALISLGTTLDKVLKDTAYGYVQSYAIKFVLPTLAAAMAPIGLLKSGKFIDNPFTIALDRSDKAGKVLAHALIDKAQGERPVTLIGFSMGARVIYSCLEELAAQSAFGLVENAVLIGSPIPSTEMSWRRMRSVVSSRLVNVYTQQDVILGFLYRARNAQLGIAGLQAIETVPAIENKDISSLVSGHNQYRLAVGMILQELDFDDIDPTFVEQESAELETEKKYEKEVYHEAKKSGQLKELEDEQGEFIMEKDERPDTSSSPTSTNNQDLTSAGEEHKPPLPVRNG